MFLKLCAKLESMTTSKTFSVFGHICLVVDSFLMLFKISRASEHHRTIVAFSRITLCVIFHVLLDLCVHGTLKIAYFTLETFWPVRFPVNFHFTLFIITSAQFTFYLYFFVNLRSMSL